MKEKVLEIIAKERTEDTKHIAAKLGITVKKAYKLCLELLAENKISKYGYWIAKESAWEDPEHSTHHYKSLTWEIV